MFHPSRRFTPPQIHAVGFLAKDYAETHRKMPPPHDEVSAGQMFSAAISCILDPESPRDCLGWRELGPLVDAGIDLADEWVQEDVLAAILEKVRARRTWMIV